MKKSLLGFMAFTAASVFANAPATAAPPTTGYQTFNFAGVCGDCAGTGLGELTLQNYTLGSQINSNNFVSFHYDGTNLLPAFTINQADLSVLGGSMYGPFPMAEDFFVLANNGQVFATGTAGYWCVGGACLADYGFSHAWTQANAAGSAVPETATWAMLILGMGAVGYAMRRQQKVRVSYAA